MDKQKRKLIIIIAVTILVFALVLIVYNNVFAGNKTGRNSDISKYEITKKEITAAKDKLNELENVKSVDIHTNNDSKIIKIVVVLKDDIEFAKIEKVAKEVLTKFSKKNIEYYDVEFYVDSENSDSKIYPKIGYKFRTNADFSW